MFPFSFVSASFHLLGGSKKARKPSKKPPFMKEENPKEQGVESPSEETPKKKTRLEKTEGKGKPYHRSPKPTPRHRKALQGIIVEGKSAGKALRDAGFSESSAENPQRILSTPGFQALLDEIGLDDAFLSNALKQDIESKPGRRVEELRLGFKIRGRLKEDQNIGVNFINTVESTREKYGL